MELYCNKCGRRLSLPRDWPALCGACKAKVDAAARRLDACCKAAAGSDHARAVADFYADDGGKVEA